MDKLSTEVKYPSKHLDNSTKSLPLDAFVLTNVVSKTPADIKRKRQSDNIYNKIFIMKNNKNKC